MPTHRINHLCEMTSTYTLATTATAGETVSMRAVYHPIK